MSVTDHRINVQAKTAWKDIRLQIGTTATSQTNKKTDAVTIPFDFQVVKVEAFALTVTAGINFQPLIGATGVLANQLTPVAGTPTNGPLAATLAFVKGKSGDILSLTYTTDGTGAATNAFVTVWIRPRPLNGEVF